MADNRAKREKLISVTKRAALPLWQSMLIRVVAILLALVVCSVLSIVVTKKNPLDIFSSAYSGAFGTAQKTWVTFQNVAFMLIVSLAVTPAFKMKFWNTGAEGQILAGGLATAVCMIYLGGKVSEPLLIIIMFVASMAAGLLWGLIPAFFKAIWNTNETLFTLMMNYVAIQLVEFFLKVADKSGSNTVGPKLLCHGILFQDVYSRYIFNISLACVLTVFMYVYLRYSKHGYEIAVVGESENTAKYVGINVKKVIIRTMALSGALCGLLGLLLVGITSQSISADTAGGRGFTAIMISWLSKFNPLIMVLFSTMIVFLDRGAVEIATTCRINASFSDILTGIIIFFIIGCEFFINYKVRINRKSRKEAEK